MKTLDEVTKIIEAYGTPKNMPDGHTINEYLRKLTTRLYYLETMRTEAKQKHDAIIFQAVNEGESVARASNKADNEVPELYLLRRIIEAGNNCAMAMSVNLKNLEKERYNAQT